MAKEPHHRHNGGPLSDEMAEKLWGHVRALEIFAEQKADIGEDEKARKALAKADGIDTNILAAIIKRRKLGAGETATADQLVRIYEEALEDQGALPLEQTRITPAPRRTVEEIATETHGQDAPEMPERADPPAAIEPVDDEEQYLRAVQLVKDNNNGSTSWLQRQLGMGFNAASRLVERMERERVLTKPDANGRRGVALFD